MTDGPSTPPPLPPAASNLFTRAIGMIVNPAGEWKKIDGESTTLAKLITNYALILAAILPIALILGVLIQGGAGGGMGTLILVAVIFYAFEIGVTVAFAFIIDALAPSLGGAKNSVQAAKLAVYASTPLFLLGILGIFTVQFLIFGSLSWLWVVAGVAWGAFLLFLGLPVLMRVPPDKAPAYVGAAAGAWTVLWLIALVLARSIMWNMVVGAAYSYRVGF